MVEQGFAIGNGITDPAIQYRAYPDFALDMGIINKADYDHLNKLLIPACELAIKLCGNFHVKLSDSLLMNAVFPVIFTPGKLIVGWLLLPF